MIILTVLLGFFVFYVPSPPARILSVEVREVSLTDDPQTWIMTISNTLDSPVLYNSTLPLHGQPQFDLAYMINGVWENKTEWGSMAACRLELLPHESTSMVCQVEIPVGTTRFKIGVLTLSPTWRAQLGYYLRANSNNRFFSDLSYTFENWDVRKRLNPNWSQEYILTNGSVILTTTN